MNIVKWLVLGIALSITHPAWSLTIVSSFPQVGTLRNLPESISKAPSGFGTYEGDYLIPDANTGVLWRLPQGGESISAFAQLPQPDCYYFTNGIFLPSTFGAYGGQFLAGGGIVPTPSCDPQVIYGQTQNGVLWAINADGNIQKLPVNVSFPSFEGDSNWVSSVTPQIAPSSFGSYGGQLFVTGGQDQQIESVINPYQRRYIIRNYIYRVDEILDVSVFSTRTTEYIRCYPSCGDEPQYTFWGMTFAPSDFDSFSGTMLVGGSVSHTNPVSKIGQIQSIDSSGTLKLFTEFPLQQIEGFVAQMGFAPNSFTGYEGKLFVSLAGKAGGGGINGACRCIRLRGQYDR